jgi:hypothetical protein
MEGRGGIRMTAPLFMKIVTCRQNNGLSVLAAMGKVGPDVVWLTAIRDWKVEGKSGWTSDFNLLPIEDKSFAD